MAFRASFQPTTISHPFILASYLIHTLFLAPAASALTLDIARDCGAVGDNRTLATQAIAHCVTLARSGDTIYVPRGVFLTGTVSLQAGTTLRFGDGGWLQGSANASHYGDDWDFWHVVQVIWRRDVWGMKLTGRSLQAVGFRVP